MYQASLKPLPPNKPLPDETGFQNYFSPPPVGQNYYMPNYYFYPQAYPQPPPVYTLPPLPPAPIYAPASLEELEAFPVNAPPNSIDSRRPGPHPPDKPLPDESGFADYLSPPPPVSPYGLSYYRPLPPTRGYYGPPPMQTYPAPMHGYYAPSYYPPPPPPVMPRPPLIQPYNRPFLGRYRVVHAPTYGQQEQPFVSTFLYGALVIVSVVLFTLLIATVFAVTGSYGSLKY
nr:extensin-1-like [Rhipicephalus microplus]